MIKQKVNTLSAQTLSLFLLILIVLNLFVYIFSLNMAVWEGFKREKVHKNLRLLRQELQSREEFFISELTHFYEANTGSFAGQASSELRFVTRQKNVAQRPGNFLR